MDTQDLAWLISTVREARSKAGEACMEMEAHMGLAKGMDDQATDEPGSQPLDTRLQLLASVAADASPQG